MDNGKSISVLNDLTETCKDGEFGFRAAAEHMRQSDTRTGLLSRADECARSAQELQACVIQLGGEPEDSGTAGGALHRGWVAVKGTLAGYSDLALLEEMERGEDVAMERYRDALKEEQLLPEVRALVERQYDGVKRNHAQIRALRDEARRVNA